jgi:hypothetical protein
LKLRFFDGHVRVVPAADLDGCPFTGPGVDLRGEDAREAFALAAPVLRWFEEREPVVLRTLAIDLTARRVLATTQETGARPRVIKIDERTDASSVNAIAALAAPLVKRLGEHAATRIELRGPRGAS